MNPRINNQILTAFSKNWVWFFVWGIALFTLGAFAISASTFTTLFSVILLGCLLLVSGVVVIIDTFSFWWRKWPGFLLHLIMGILYVVVGSSLINNPSLSSISLTLFLAWLFIFVGAFRILYSLTLRSPRWGWSFLNGVITFILGGLIMAQWPASGLYIIGLFVGIDLLFCGWAYMMLALGVRALD